MINIGLIKKHHKDFLSNHDAMVASVLTESKLQDYAQRYVHDNSGLKMRSGNLEKSTKVKVIRTRNGSLIKVQNNAKYAWSQDQGSGLYGRRRSVYTITGNPYLRFRGLGGRIIYRHKVMHPGVRPKRFLFNTTDAMARTVAAWLETGMKSVARKF